jgi:hypothetical protein
MSLLILTLSGSDTRHQSRYTETDLTSASLSNLKTSCFPKADTLKQLRPIGKGDQELEKRLDQKELT